jgi:CDGSH-type Zn-finger protein
MADKKYRVKITNDGPYLVSEDVPVHQDEIVPDEQKYSADWEKGKDYDGKGHAHGGQYALCRCGHSKNMPFCDGTHIQNGFNNNEVADKTPYKEVAKLYNGGTIDLFDNPALCAVARFCDRFDDAWHMTIRSGKENPDFEAKAIDETCKCPSGRLTSVTKDGKVIEPDLEMEIGVVEDVPKGFKGPLWVKGGIQIEGADGSEYEVRNRVTLCRCGESSNMPFCDASHLRCRHMQHVDEK